MANRVKIVPELFRWAAERARLEWGDLCEKFPKLGEWESGDVEPTMKQLEQFAARTYTPLGYLFLPQPPKEELPIPDFRTVDDGGVARPSPHLLDTIFAIQQRQIWMAEFLADCGEDPLPFVGSKSLRDSPEEIAEAIREHLNLSHDWARNHKTWEEALRALIGQIEAAGILMMVNGVVGNNTSRPLSVEEFRGFALCDDHAPAIFINGADAKAAQMFTLVHELAHIWVGKEGVSDLADMQPGSNAIEILCNQAAAEFLVPATEIRAAWAEANASGHPIEKLARQFKVSEIVVARRALDLDLISKREFFQFYESYLERLAAIKAKRENGGNFYLTQGVRLGKRFASAICSAARAGQVSYRDAYRLTGLSGTSYDRFAKEMGLRA